MLKKFSDNLTNKFTKGTPVYIVTKEGAILEGYHIDSSLMNLVSLDRSPLDGTEKQGFTIDGDLLRPNWCAGKRQLVGACIDKSEAEALAALAIKKLRPGAKNFNAGDTCRKSTISK